jgi:hypothetical protein
LPLLKVSRLSIIRLLSGSFDCPSIVLLQIVPMDPLSDPYRNRQLTVLKKFLRVLAFTFSALFLAQCGDLGIDGQKDLFGAIGFKSGAVPIMAPAASSCGASAGTTGGTTGTTTGSTAPGRCLSEAEAANAITAQCADCAVVLAFKGTNEQTMCGSIAISTDKTIYGVGASKLIADAQAASLASCQAKEVAAKITPSTCALSMSQCLK